jgi:hypothetical protein
MEVRKSGKRRRDYLPRSMRDAVPPDGTPLRNDKKGCYRASKATVPDSSFSLPKNLLWRLSHGGLPAFLGCSS